MFNVLLGDILCALHEPAVMGIVNVSADSFYTSVTQEADILALVRRHVADGASVIDIGGCSTRPNSEYVSESVEWQRVSKALDLIRHNYSEITLSIDTFRASIAQKSVEQYGVTMINDISGGQLDSEMFSTVGKLSVPYVLTHFQGQVSELTGDDYIASVIDYFQRKIYKLKHFGVKDIFLDLGFGFGKTIEQNYLLLKRIADFKILGFPILVGLSHKSMIYKVIGAQANDAGYGTTAVEMAALLNGADIVRTHNVKSVADSIKILSKINTL